MEKWKVIEATDGLYEVSDMGNIRFKGRPVPVKHSATGYCMVQIGLKFGSRHFNLHQVVAAYFVENKCPETYTQVNHLDGDKDNNKASNLEWCTPKQNQQHRIQVLGKDMLGENNPMYGIGGEASPVFKGYLLQINPSTGEVVGRYAGSGEASRAVGGTPSNILRVVGKDRTYHGYKWIRKE
jgi:hypothetical protein